MPKSLRDTIQQPTYTKAVIKLALRSSKGARQIWCVVEAPDDAAVYRKFFNDAAVSVLPSDDENGKRSYRNVESIVSELYQEENNPYLFGIRDCDYTRYDDNYVMPGNVFVTDCRDMEMMLFAASSVIAELTSWNVLFSEKIEACAKVERYLGYLRIYNDIRQLSCRFHDKLTKVSLVWDFSSHAIKADYKENLFVKFRDNCQDEVTEEDFNRFIEEKRLEDEPYVNVCRGHDMFNLLPAMMIQREYSQAKDILNRMIAAYSYEDFSKTLLHKNISRWADCRNLAVFLG